MYTSKNKKVVDVFRLLVHIERIEMQRFYVRNGAANNEDLRISFMLNEIDEKTFASKLQKREKERKKKHEYYQIYQMVYNTGAEYIRQIHNYVSTEIIITPSISYPYTTAVCDITSDTTKEHILECVQMIDNLRKYANESFKNVGTRYKCTYPQISQNWLEII